MTVLDDRPVTNGHQHEPPLALPSQPIGPSPLEPEPTEPDHMPEEAPEVAHLRRRLANRKAELALAEEFAEVDAREVFNEVRDEDEQHADRQVARIVRKKQRKDRQRSGKAAVRRGRWARFQARLDERAERTRDKILDPARTIGADYRRWMATSAVLFSLLAGGAAYMSRTAHHGLVGVDGTWLAYLVEPLASLVLVLSMLAQFTARQRGIPVPKGFIALDVALAVASLLLMTVPWGLRFGWDGGTLAGHLLMPGLIVVCVTAWHLASGIYSQAIANSKHDPTLKDRLSLLRKATASGELPPEASANQVMKHLRSHLDSGIGHEAARKVARNFLGY